MSKQLVIKISLYLIAFVLANFIVLWLGPYGLIITALFLIPFDFVMRCVFHEQWKGADLVAKLGTLVIIASALTYVINHETENIALGSMTGFITAQVFAGLFYQATIKKKFFIKVNGSDLVGIIFDSIVFQLVAFGSVDPIVFFSQVFLKAVGGLFWYYVIFNKFKLHQTWFKQ